MGFPPDLSHKIKRYQGQRKPTSLRLSCGQNVAIGRSGWTLTSQTLLYSDAAAVAAGCRASFAMDYFFICGDVASREGYVGRIDAVRGRGGIP